MIMFFGVNLMVCLLVYMLQKDVKVYVNIYIYGFLRYIINFVKIFMVNLKKKKICMFILQVDESKKKKIMKIYFYFDFNKLSIMQ